MLTPDFGGDRLRLAVGLPPRSFGCSQKGRENFFWLCAPEVLWNQFHFRLAFGFTATERQIGANRRNALLSKAPGPGKRQSSLAHTDLYDFERLVQHCHRCPRKGPNFGPLGREEATHTVTIRASSPRRGSPIISPGQSGAATAAKRRPGLAKPKRAKP